MFNVLDNINLSAMINEPCFSHIIYLEVSSNFIALYLTFTGRNITFA